MPDLIAGLRDLGRIPGENIIIECRSAGKRYEGFATATAELVRLPVDVIVSESQPAGHMARSVTKTVPIVTILSGDPVGSGLVQSLSKPGGNLTGLTYYATELTGKRLELLKEMVPGISSVGVLANPDVSYLPFEEDTKRGRPTPRPCAGCPPGSRAERVGRRHPSDEGGGSTGRLCAA